MNEKDPDLLAIIRAAMKPKAAKASSSTKTSSVPVDPFVTRVPRKDVHGKLGDFTRSNSNPPTRTNNTAIVGYEEVPRTRFSQNKTNGDNKSQSITAETEMVRKAIKLVLNRTGGAPSKRAAKQMAAPKMTRSDRVFQSGKGCGPGSSRSPVLDRIKAIAADETGCIVREQMKDRRTKAPLAPITEAQSQRNSNTTQGNYNPMIVE